MSMQHCLVQPGKAVKLVVRSIEKKVPHDILISYTRYMYIRILLYIYQYRNVLRMFAILSEIVYVYSLNDTVYNKTGIYIYTYIYILTYAEIH